MCCKEPAADPSETPSAAEADKEKKENDAGMLSDICKFISLSEYFVDVTDLIKSTFEVSVSRWSP